MESVYYAQRMSSMYDTEEIKLIVNIISEQAKAFPAATNYWDLRDGIGQRSMYLLSVIVFAFIFIFVLVLVFISVFIFVFFPVRHDCIHNTVKLTNSKLAQK